jgi:hypothetical protein
MQGPISAPNAINANVTHVAWNNLPTWFVVASNDRAMVYASRVCFGPERQLSARKQRDKDRKKKNRGRRRSGTAISEESFSNISEMREVLLSTLSVFVPADEVSYTFRYCQTDLNSDAFELNEYFDTSSFTAPGPFAFGNLPRISSVGFVLLATLTQTYPPSNGVPDLLCRWMS